MEPNITSKLDPVRKFKQVNGEGGGGGRSNRYKMVNEWITFKSRKLNIEGRHDENLTFRMMSTEPKISEMLTNGAAETKSENYGPSITGDHLHVMKLDHNDRVQILLEISLAVTTD